VIALKIRLNLCQRQACPGSHCILVAALLKNLDTRQDSWLVLPEGLQTQLTFTRYC